MSLLDEARNHALSNYHTTPDSNQEKRFSPSVIGDEISTNINKGTNRTGILEAAYQPPPPSEHLASSLDFSDFVMPPNCLVPGGFGNPFDDSSSNDLLSMSTLSEGLMQDGSNSSTTEASSFQDTQNSYNISPKELQLSDEMEFFNSMWETNPNFSD
jgi:hypothetical protein